MTAPGGGSDENARSGVNPPGPETSWTRPDLGAGAPFGYPPPGYPPPGYPPPGYPPPPGVSAPPGHPPPGYGPPVGFQGPGHGAPVGYPPPGYGAPYPGGYGPPRPRTNRLAIAAVVVSIIGLLSWPFAVIGVALGAVALNQLKRSGEDGYGLAVTGIAAGTIIGLIGLIVAISPVG